MSQPLARALGLDRNPLRRRIDRVQRGLFIVLTVLFLVAAPLLATVAGHWTRAAGIRGLDTERAWVMAPRSAPDVRARTGVVPVGPAAAAGSSTREWVNRAGSPTRAPLQAGLLRENVALAECLTVYALAIVAFLIARAGRILLDRCRLAAWEEEWRSIGPRWRQQR